ncbi:NAD-dependent epimerase/dehydratase family protein [Rhodococcus sp. Z13]|uniref:NAD-dependent epimerase/dehydratase family protein n=1 Tax=Rhodococcus sacchari TaxID=2962047 RepID=A0ACD4DCR1_9NOCA|nr:NAD-dependent epimerase/dehydratase family protein [Rhodococcus sp. Z13]UYP17787.1 NAD-dependent epimerase/dehydratase family protein [Rhodococcus sp. Z13]
MDNEPEPRTEPGLKVVVIGATGNVGTGVVGALSREPAVDEIVGVARRPTNWSCPKTSFTTADIRSDDLRPIVRGADAVIHLAWLFQPTHRPEVTWSNNVLGAISVFEAVAAEGVPALLYSSSVAAYSPGSSTERVTEEWPTHGRPGAAYPREKSYLERYLDAFELRNPETRLVRIRPYFIFKRESATSQRRLFLGPFLPGNLVRGGLLPVVPLVKDLRFQVLHTSDVADAFARAVVRPVRGAFNLATEPAVDGAYLADLFSARGIPMPRTVLREAVRAAWRTHLAPASPGLLDTVLSLPLLDCTRARTELGWTPRYSPQEALGELLTGLQEGAGMPTAPLAPDSLRRRMHEVATRVGRRP